MHTVANSNSSMWNVLHLPELGTFITVGIRNNTNSALQNHFAFVLYLSCTASPAALAGCPERYSKLRSGVSKYDRVVSGQVVDQAIKRGFVAGIKGNWVVAEFYLAHQAAPLRGLGLTSSPSVALP